MKVKQHRLPDLDCPRCGTKIDAAIGITTSQGPRPSDGTVCLSCEEIMIFTGEGERVTGIRTAEPKEVLENLECFLESIKIVGMIRHMMMESKREEDGGE